MFPSFACVGSLHVYFTLLKGLLLPLLWNWQEIHSVLVERAAFSYPLKNREQDGCLLERLSPMDMMTQQLLTATSHLPFSQSHGDTSQTTDVRFWVVFAMFPGGGWYQTFFCQCCGVCYIIVERTKNPFVMLDCKEHAFSHSIGSFSENSLTGHHAGCQRYRPVWLGSCHGIITSHGDTVLARASWNTSSTSVSPYLAILEGMCPRQYKVVGILLAWPL